MNAIPNPTIDSFSSSAQSISVNESITLSWSTSNTTECLADGDWAGSKELNGTETLELTSVKTYTFDLTCTGVKEIAITESVSVVVEGEQTEDLGCSYYWRWRLLQKYGVVKIIYSSLMSLMDTNHASQTLVKVLIGHLLIQVQVGVMFLKLSIRLMLVTLVL